MVIFVGPDRNWDVLMAPGVPIKARYWAAEALKVLNMAQRVGKRANAGFVGAWGYA